MKFGGKVHNSHFYDDTLYTEQIIRVYCFDLYFAVDRIRYIYYLSGHSHRPMNPKNYQIPEIKRKIKKLLQGLQ